MLTEVYLASICIVLVMSERVSNALITLMIWDMIVLGVKNITVHLFAPNVPFRLLTNFHIQSSMTFTFTHLVTISRIFAGSLKTSWTYLFIHL